MRVSHLEKQNNSCLAILSFFDFEPLLRRNIIIVEKPFIDSDILVSTKGEVTKKFEAKLQLVFCKGFRRLPLKRNRFFVGFHIHLPQFLSCDP